MKFLLNANTELCKIPELKELLRAEKFPYNRTGEIIDWIEDHSRFQFYNNSALAIKISTYNQNEILHYYSDETIDEYVLNGHQFSIVEVDTSEPWTIETDEYGNEGVLYLDTVEDSLNFYGCEPGIELAF